MKKQKPLKRIPWWETNEPCGYSYYKGWWKKFQRKVHRLIGKRLLRRDIQY